MNLWIESQLSMEDMLLEVNITTDDWRWQYNNSIVILITTFLFFFFCLTFSSETSEHITYSSVHWIILAFYNKKKKLQPKTHATFDSFPAVELIQSQICVLTCLKNHTEQEGSI